MSIAAPDEKRPWALAGVAASLVLLLAAGLVFLDLPGEQLLSRGGRDAPSVTGAALPQARWEIKTHPAGVMKKVTKAQGERIARQRPQVAAVVKRVYDAMFLRPGRLQESLRRNFTAAAATALRRSGATVAEPGIVTTKKRSARIGIQAAGGPTLAVATVSVRASLADNPLRRITHDSTLWMERRKTGWKVVAFQVDQRPVKTAKTAPAGKKDRKKKRG